MLVILVGPVPEGADGPIPVEAELAVATGAGTGAVPGPPASADDDLDLVYGNEETRGGAGQRVVRVAHDAYTEGLDLARRCAAQAVRRFGELPRELRPDEIEMQLAIKVDAGVAALVKSGAEAQLQLTLRWRTAPVATVPGGADGAVS